jgi:hypothetical protein
MMKLEERKIELEKEFKTLAIENEKLIENGKTLNKRMSEIRARQLELRGAFAEVSKLLGEKTGETKKGKKK